jgi:SAM-dependent methyltransferase
MFNNIVKNSYNCVAEEWNETRKNLHWEEFDFFYDKIPFKKWVNILDLWCWTWRLFDFFKSKWLESKNYVWIDLSEKMLVEAKKNYPNNNFFYWDISSKNFEKNFEKNNIWKFDQIWCIAMLHHLWNNKNRITAIKNFDKILNKNWKIFLTVWNLYQKKSNISVKKLNKKSQKNKFEKILNKSFWRNIFSFGFYSKQDCFFYWKDSKILRYYYAFKKKEIISLFEENWFTVKFFDEWKNFSLILEK